MNGNCHFVFGAACGTMLAVNADKIETVLPNITARQLYRQAQRSVKFVYWECAKGIRTNRQQTQRIAS